MPSSPLSVPSVLRAVLWSCACALATAWIATVPAPAVPPGGVARDFNWNHDRDEVLKLGDKAVPTLLPYGFEDFDLFASLELSEGAELDVVTRLVLPSPRYDEQGGESLEPFHGRFHLLRLVAGGSVGVVGEGAFRTRAQALFSDAAAGVSVVPGVGASLHLQARGRRIRANVAGRWTPWAETVDDRGRIALVGRGGTVVLRHLKVLHIPRGAERPWLLAGGIGLLIALLGGALLGGGPRRRWWFLGLGVVAVCGGSLAARSLCLEALLPDLVPQTGTRLLCALWAVPLAFGLAGGARRWQLPLGVLLAALLFEAVCQRVWPRSLAAEDPRIALHFGPESGDAAFNALACRIRNRGPVVHSLDLPDRRVVFLGGGMVFEHSPDFRDHVGLRTALAVGQQLGERVEGIVVPTVLSNVHQQLALYRRFYRRFAPQALVFAVTRFESAEVDGRPARSALEEEASPPPSAGVSAAWTLLTAGRTVRRQSTSTPATLRATLDDLAALAEQDGFAVVLVTESGLEPALQEVVDHFAAQRSVPLVRGFDAPAGLGKDALIAPLVEAMR